MFIVSEIFPQHGGDLVRAEQMILQSKLAGADAVKVQLYRADMFPSPEGKSRDYLELSFDGLVQLKEYADSISIDLFATAFDLERLKWCDELDFRYQKVAARMHREDPELMEQIIARGKTTFISVPHDLDPATVKPVEKGILLHCVGKYPARLDEMTIPDFNQSVYEGLSDHSLGIAAALLACARGASYLEKHFTISRNLQNITELAHLGAMDASELAQIRKLTSEMELIGEEASQ